MCSNKVAELADASDCTGGAAATCMATCGNPAAAYTRSKTALMGSGVQMTMRLPW